MRFFFVDRPAAWKPIGPGYFPIKLGWDSDCLLNSLWLVVLLCVCVCVLDCFVLFCLFVKLCFALCCFALCVLIVVFCFALSVLDCFVLFVC